MHPDDPLRRILHIDLTHARFEIEEHPGLFAETLGGAGAAIRLLDDHCPAGADPLGPDNPIVLAVGPLVGLYPMASKTVAMFKSPHTGNLGESHAGGRSAVSIRMAGYGAIVIHGMSPSPVYLLIEDSRVTFRDAAALWGLRSSYTVGTVLREREKGSGNRSILRIGPAGERLVSYASVITETYRHFGRLGLGAVFGSKRLKGIVIVGRRGLPVVDPQAYRGVYDAVHQAATRSDAMRKYHDLGTPMNVLPLNEIGALPTRNLSSGRFEAADALSGEAMAASFLGRRLACAHCPVACIHLAALRSPHPKEPYFYKTSMLAYDYEPIFALGTMLGIADAAAVLHLADEVEIQGLDAMSTGGVLAWATEARQRGRIAERDLDGIELEWGGAEAYAAAVRRLVSQPTDLYRAMARGVDHAASRYGGEEFALAFGGNEMPGYHTGPGCHLGFLLGSRHSHLDSAGYGIDQRAAGRPTAEDLVDALLAEERWRQVLASLVVCFFARGVYTPDTVRDALAAIGVQRSEAELERAGAETLRRKHAFKAREGFDLSALRIPGRICELPTPVGLVSVAFLRDALSIASERIKLEGR